MVGCSEDAIRSADMPGQLTAGEDTEESASDVPTEDVPLAVAADEADAETADPQSDLTQPAALAKNSPKPQNQMVLRGGAQPLPPGAVAINETNFPDPVFRELVKDFDQNGNDILEASELSAVTVIDYYDSTRPDEQKIADAKGVEHFTELKLLDFGNNKLTELNVSQNTKLEVLCCNENAISFLDLSKNNQLLSLNCSENHLTAIELTGDFYTLAIGDPTYPPSLRSTMKDGKYQFDFSKIPHVNLSKIEFVEQMKETGTLPEGVDYNYETGILTVDPNIVRNPAETLPSVIYWYSVDAIESGGSYVMKSFPFTGSVQGFAIASIPMIKFYVPSTRMDVTVKLDYTRYYDVTLDPDNGGLNEAITRSVAEKTKYTLPACPFTAPEGKQFKAWAVDGAEKQPGDVLTILSDTFIKAVWADDQPETVTFDPAGGRWPDGSSVVKILRAKAGTEIRISEAPAREGYRFLYWQEPRYQPGERYTVPAGGHAFVAVWEKITAGAPQQPPAGQQPIKPDSPAESQKSAEPLPRTGEQGGVDGWSGLLLLSVAGLSVMLRRRRGLLR